MDAQRSTGGLLSSPAAAQRCAEGAGLDSGAAVEAQSAMPSIALLLQCTDRTRLSTHGRIHGASPSVSNLHQLDGRDLEAPDGSSRAISAVTLGHCQVSHVAEAGE
jgi:hypothetical protein